MTIAFWCVLAAIMMPYTATLFAKRHMPLSENKAPRVYKATLEGAKQRAIWAEANHFESFPGFAAAVIIAHIAQGNQTLIDGLAMGYIGARALYVYLYIADRSTLRSIVWFAALGCIIGLFVCAASAGLDAH